MLIANRMSSPVRTVRPCDSVRHARQVLEGRRIHSLPVVSGGTVVGIVTDHDLYDAYRSLQAWPAAASRASIHDGDIEDVPIEVVMTTDVLTLAPRDTLADAVVLMRSARISAIPIVENGTLVGILTRSDVLDAFLELEHPGRDEREDARPQAV